MTDPIYKGYIDKKYFVKPSMFKFINMVKSEEYIIIINISKFVKYAFEKRTASQDSGKYSLKIGLHRYAA